MPRTATKPTRCPADPLLAFRAGAIWFVHARGWRGADADDLVSEMTRIALEHQPLQVALRYAYLQARDILDPRVREQGKPTSRRSHAACSYDTTPLMAPRSLDDPPLLLQDALAAPVRHESWVECEEHLPPRGPVRAMLLLRYAYGFRQREIARLFGLHESRINQMCMAWREVVRHREENA